MTEYFSTPQTNDHDWVAHFEKVRDKELQSYNENLHNEMPYLATVPDIADESFVYMCSKADYTAFFIGHTAGDPPPIAPRYEFLEALRAMPNRDAVQERVARNMNLIVGALDRTKFSLDREHNFLSKKSLVKIVPFVVFNAHEKCKALGRKLEAELRSVVIANLQVLKKLRGLKVSDVEFSPISVRKFIERFAHVIEEESKRDPTRYRR